MTDSARCRRVRYWTEKGERVALQTPWPLHSQIQTTESARWQATLNVALEGYMRAFILEMIGVCTALNLFEISCR